MHPDQLRKNVKEKSITYVTTGMIEKFGYTLATILGYLMKEEEYAIKMCQVREQEYDSKDFKLTISKHLALLDLNISKPTYNISIGKLERANAIEIINSKLNCYKINWGVLEDVI
jgi:hypothetical protein